MIFTEPLTFEKQTFKFSPHAENLNQQNNVYKERMDTITSKYRTGGGVTRRRTRKKTSATRKSAKQSLIEVIYQKKIKKYTNVLEAEKHLNKLHADVRLDLHGVLDILPNDIPILKDRTHKIACISFVGPNTHMEAITDIKNRITNGQIDFGVLVFRRGKGKDKFTYVEEGSKAWVNSQIQCNKSCIFIDDSTDHLRSTKHLNPHIECFLFNTKIQKQLLQLLSKWETI